MEPRRTGAVVVTLLVVAAAGMAAGPASEPATEPARPVHTDAAAMAGAAGDALAALMRNDAAAVGPAIKRIEAGCRELLTDEGAAQGPGVRNRDQALHVVLRGTRLHASQGDVDEAFEQFVWVLRTCRECHAIARQQGRLPSGGPLWQPDDGGIPNRAETTPPAPTAP